MIKRYSFYSDIYHDVHEQEDDSGEYTHYEDYNTLLRQFKDFVEVVSTYNTPSDYSVIKREIGICKEFIKEIEE